jgi:hypothetical protein
MLALTKVSHFYIKLIEQTNNLILVLKKGFLKIISIVIYRHDYRLI